MLTYAVFNHNLDEEKFDYASFDAQATSLLPVQKSLLY